jgi:hypothetical protein
MQRKSYEVTGSPVNGLALPAIAEPRTPGTTTSQAFAKPSSPHSRYSGSSREVRQYLLHGFETSLWLNCSIQAPSKRIPRTMYFRLPHTQNSISSHGQVPSSVFRIVILFRISKLSWFWKKCWIGIATASARPVIACPGDSCRSAGYKSESEDGLSWWHVHYSSEALRVLGTLGESTLVDIQTLEEE